MREKISAVIHAAACARRRENESVYARGGGLHGWTEGARDHRVSLACRTSFPVGRGKSIQRLRATTTASINAQGPGALHGDYHIACHIVGAPREGEEEARRDGWKEERKEDEDPQREDGTERRWTRRM